MSRNFVSLFIVVSVVVLAAWAAPCSANLIANGSFENGSAGSEFLPSGENPDLANWTVSPNNGGWFYELNSGPFTPPAAFAAEDGTAKLLVAGGSGSSNYILSDAFAVTAGSTYTLSYWERLRGSTSGPQGIYAVITASGGTLTGTQGNMDSIAGSGTGAITWVAAGITPAADWTNFTATFVPSISGSATLTFYNGDETGAGPYYGSALDNVSVTGVPEPGTLVLLAAGLAGLLCYAWRKRP